MNDRGDVLRFQHSTLTLEHGPAGTIGRIDYHTKPKRRYVGPLPPETVDLLREVADQ